MDSCLQRHQPGSHKRLVSLALILEPEESLILQYIPPPSPCYACMTDGNGRNQFYYNGSICCMQLCLDRNVKQFHGEPCIQSQ